jgi:hypothetical protein
MENGQIAGKGGIVLAVTAEIAETDRREKKATRVVAECAVCPNNPRFCYYCFPKYH